ncbi:formyltransferase family protein [Mesorhizobium sp. LHD-90]|uniref:formyltransferase family protein n=1 Tax=Mesorhizobium sp. LHD-90 TaxID=3071414 RepID=UPI0027E0BCB2|nr:formyltransferase family protein [Mesorhizobium sp. LHD-90]MDQ6433006.1 formyltransferase family protein [Mesorhizobium sp. LHD-90]
MDVLSDTHRRIVVVTEGGFHIWGIVNALSARFGPVTVILEQPESKWAILKRRARRQGWLSVAGQIGTMVVIRTSKVLLARRLAAVAVETGFDATPPKPERTVEILSANSPEFLDALRRLAPEAVLLAGCRLLKSETLAGISCPVLNYHAGITPKYRGMNGGYWALATGDAENFGTTVHLADAGVDTGAILYQERGKPSKSDTIATYALTQAAFSREIIVRALQDALTGKLVPVDTGLPSRQWYHPTLWRYLWTGLIRNVW